jgi:hypothetical protein
MTEFNHVLYAAGSDTQFNGYVVKFNGDNVNPKWTRVDQNLSGLDPERNFFVSAFDNTEQAWKAFGLALLFQI